MKKITILFVLLVVFAVGARAQGLSGGVKLGLNLANQTYSGGGFTTSPNFLPTFHAGGYVTFMFTERIGLQPEVLYSGQGYKSGNTSVKLAYVAIPVLVRFNVNDLLSFHVGPQIGLLTSAKADDGTNSTDIKDGLKGTDVGVAVGTGIDLPMKLNFNVRVIVGLSNINDEPASNVTVKNYTVQVSVGYKLFGAE